MRSSDVWATAAGLFVLIAASWIVWLTDPSEPVLFALLAIVAVVSAVLMTLVVPRPRRALAASLVIVVPLVGPFLAAWMVTARGRDGAGLLRDPEAPQTPLDAVEVARRLTCVLPPCDALVSRDTEVRRATIARLASRASFEDLRLLRWARAHHDPEIAAEIALALEEIDERFVRELRVARAAAKERPEYATHAAVFELIGRSLLAGIVDASLVGKLAAEARLHHDAAIALDANRARQLLATRVRVELAVGRPEVVLELLDEWGAGSSSGELGKLYLEAAYARRAFALIPSVEGRSTRRGT